MEVFRDKLLARAGFPRDQYAFGEPCKLLYPSDCNQRGLAFADDLALVARGTLDVKKFHRVANRGDKPGQSYWFLQKIQRTLAHAREGFLNIAFTGNDDALRVRASFAEYFYQFLAVDLVPAEENIEHGNGGWFFFNGL